MWEGTLPVDQSNAQSLLAGDRRIEQHERELSEKEGCLLTTKRDKDAHGIGTQNMSAVVRKYHGEISARAENGKFVLTLTFPIDRLSQEWHHTSQGA